MVDWHKEQEWKVCIRGRRKLWPFQWGFYPVTHWHKHMTKTGSRWEIEANLRDLRKQFPGIEVDVIQ